MQTQLAPIDGIQTLFIVRLTNFLKNLEYLDVVPKVTHILVLKFLTKGSK